MARGGAYVSLDQDGAPRIERGFIRPEDEPPTGQDTAQQPGGLERDGAPASDGGLVGVEDDEGSGGDKRLSDALVRDLSAHRTLGLRLALGEQPDVALIAVTHALAAQTFYRAYDEATCLEIRPTTTPLGGHADGIADTAAAKALADRHEAWAVQMPHDAADLWAFVVALDDTGRTRLFAHCAALTVFAVRQQWDNKRGAQAAADTLAAAVSLDMVPHWAPTVRTYLGRVTKTHIMQAVRESAVTRRAVSGLTECPAE